MISKTENAHQTDVYPTVNHGNFNIRLTSNEKGKVKVNIFNTLGVMTKEIQLNKSLQTESILHSIRKKLKKASIC